MELDTDSEQITESERKKDNSSSDIDEDEDSGQAIYYDAISTLPLTHEEPPFSGYENVLVPPKTEDTNPIFVNQLEDEKTDDKDTGLVELQISEDTDKESLNGSGNGKIELEFSSTSSESTDETKLKQVDLNSDIHVTQVVEEVLTNQIDSASGKSSEITEVSSLLQANSETITGSDLTSDLSNKIETEDEYKNELSEREEKFGTETVKGSEVTEELSLEQTDLKTSRNSHEQSDFRKVQETDILNENEVLERKEKFHTLKSEKISVKDLQRKFQVEDQSSWKPQVVRRVPEARAWAQGPRFVSSGVPTVNTNTDQYFLAQPTWSEQSSLYSYGEPTISDSNRLNENVQEQIKNPTLQKFNIEDQSKTELSPYCLAQPIESGSKDNEVQKDGSRSHNKKSESDSDDGYVEANKLRKSLSRKPVVKYRYSYEPPWNDEFPTVMVPVSHNDMTENEEKSIDLSLNTEKNPEIITEEKVEDKAETDLNKNETLDGNLNQIERGQIVIGAGPDFEASGKYNHLFEGSISEEPKMDGNQYGNLYAEPLEDPPEMSPRDIQDNSMVPSLPILVSSGVYANAYQGIVDGANAIKNRREASIRSQENPYEDVQSTISDNTFGWDDSEFDSDSGTDYENSPEADDDIIDKPLPPTPREQQAIQEPMYLTQIERPKRVKHRKYGAPGNPMVVKHKKRMRAKKAEAALNNRNTPILPVSVNLERHPPPSLPPAPEGLENHQMKRRYAIRSLIESEKSYIETCKRLTEEYKNTLMTTFGLKNTSVEVILNKVEQILDIHQMFQIELAEKVTNWDEKEEIGKLFIGFFSRSLVIDLYSEYVNNFSGAMEDLKSLQTTRSALASFLTEMAVKSPDRLPIFGLLVKPVQRFPQFITILQDILKYTPHEHHDRSSLQTALTDLENVAHKLNEAKRMSEQRLQAKKLIKEIKTSSFRPDSFRPIRLLRQDDLNLICTEKGDVRSKPKRLFLTDSHLICTTVIHREQDNKPSDRVRLKWAIPLSELELKENSISPDLSCSVKNNGGILSIHTRRETLYQESDPLNLQNDLEDMIHDLSVLGQMSSLVGTLKCSYANIPEEVFHETISDLQRKIQVKNQQLQILNSCTILLEHSTSQKKERYTFQTVLPEMKQEWSTDFLLAKLCLDPLNTPSWTSLSGGDQDVTKQPALFMKFLPVDMPRYFTKMKCAVPVYLASHGSSDIGIQHLWVVMTTDCRTQVALVSVQNTKPSLVESFQASSDEVIAVEIVPGYAVKECADAFMEDTVWMSTKRKEVLVFSVFNEQGLRDQTKLNRSPKKVFCSHGVGLQIHYTVERVFLGTDEGVLVIYDRDEDGIWNFECPNIVQLASCPINSIISVDEEVWVGCGQHTYIIPVEESCFLQQIEMVCKEGSDIAHMVRSGVGLWIAHEGSSSVHLYHIETKSHLQEINIAQSVHALVNGNRDYSTGSENSYTITSLMASKGFLWVGTNVGVLLAFPLPRLKDGVPIISGRPFVSYHGHNGPVQFLIPIYCGTVNLWHKARGLDYNTIDNRQLMKNPSLSQGTKGKHLICDNEDTSSQASSDGDYIQMSGTMEPPSKVKGENNPKISGKQTVRPGENVKNLPAKPTENRKGSPTKDESGSSGKEKPQKLENSEKNSQKQSSENKQTPVPPKKPKKLKGRPETPPKPGSGDISSPGNPVQQEKSEKVDEKSSSLSATSQESASNLKLIKENRLSRSADDISNLIPKETDDTNSKGKTLKLPRQLAARARQKFYQTLGPSLGFGDDNINDYYRDLMRNESLTDPVKTELERTPSNVSKTRSFSLRNIGRSRPSQSSDRNQSKRTGNASIRVATDEPKLRALDTLSKRGCSSVMVIMGGDGYIDWRKKSSNSIKNSESSLIMWLYKC